MESVRKKHTPKNNVAFVFLSLFVFPFFVNAAPAAPSQGDLDDLQAQRVLYEAKAALAKAKLAAEGDSSVGTISVNDGHNASGGNSKISGIPTLSKINGSKAELILSNGETIIISTGAMLPGGRWQVTGVGLSGVTIKDIHTSSKQVLN